MGKILIIKGADFSQVAVDKVTQTGGVTITAIASPTGGGTVSTVSGGGSYTSGTKITLVAAPASGYIFSQWSDGVTTAERVITVGSSSATYTAVFVEKSARTETMSYLKSSTLIATSENLSALGSLATYAGFAIYAVDVNVGDKVRLKSSSLASNAFRYGFYNKAKSELAIGDIAYYYRMANLNTEGGLPLTLGTATSNGSCVIAWASERNHLVQNIKHPPASK